MRKTHNLPWMGRTAVAGIVALVGLGLFAGSASAQTMVYDYDNAMAWWNAYDCPAMKVLLPRYADGDGPGTGTDAETTANHEKRVCVMWPDLPLRDRLVIETFIGSTMTNNHESNKDWWTANPGAVTRQILAGANSIVAVADGLTGAAGSYNGDQNTAAATTGFATAFDEDYGPAQE